MANILLTTTCNLSCEYCFAKEKMMGKRAHMSLEDAYAVMHFLKRSGYPIFRVMGGEPTLHPHFETIINRALNEGFRVDILSNATWKPEMNAFFARISPNRLYFLLNIDNPAGYTPRKWDRVEQNLAAVSKTHKITLSFNLFEVEPKFDYILEICNTYGIDKVRMSFSLPVLGAENAFLPFEDYPKMASFILDSVHRAEKQGVSIKMDNAVPLCMFTYAQAGELIMKGVLDLEYNARCRPIVDVGPDLQVWSCFCLSKLDNRRLSEFANLDQLQEHYQKLWDQFQGKIFPMEACYHCRYKDEFQCQGGCLTHAVTRFGEHRLGEIPENQPRPLRKEMLLALSPDLRIQRFSIPQESFLLTQMSSGKEVELDGSFELVLTLLRKGEYTAGEIIELFLGETNGNSMMESFSRHTLEDGMMSMLSGLCKEGFLEGARLMETA